ncbi:MAG: hypothetical protein AB8F94_11685 [Saprospiraceae bacterium]
MNFISKKALFTIFIFIIFFSCRNDKTLPALLEFNQLQLVEVPTSLNEISGMVFRNDMSVFAHNDGGQGARIFEINLTEKKVNRNIKIYNAINFDWEDMAQDDEYIYVSDSGNNLGQRTDLKIYKISKNDLEIQDSVAAEIIEFEYPDQEIFSPTEVHNFDCEAIISFENELFLFSKNHLDQKTKLYSLSKNVGSHTANLLQEFNADGLITGATISEDNNVITLLGYHKEVVNQVEKFDPFIWLLYDFEENKIFEGKTKKLDIEIKTQMEAICFGNKKNLYFSHESETLGLPQFIYTVDLEPFLN